MAAEINNQDFTNTELLKQFLDQNRGVDFQFFDLRDEVSINGLNFENLTDQKTELISLLKGFQRLIRIIPEKNRDAALLLMKQGVHSALQIAAMTRRDFLGKYAGLFNDNEVLADAIYKSALKKRSMILVQYMNILQNGEPHISAARFS